jgi:hypothetical protein
MLSFVILFKTLLELVLMFVLGRTVLGWLAGEKRFQNLFWRILDSAAHPALALTQKCLWRTASPATVTMLTLAWLTLVWGLLAILKLRYCLTAGVGVC